MKKSKIILSIAITILAAVGFNFLPIASTHATTNVCDSDVPQSIKDANGCGGGGAGTTDISSAIVGVINGIIGIFSAVAAIFVVVGGYYYMTSGGDPGKVKKAKDTILYALIGLAVAALAFAIVNFVIVNIINK